VTATNVVSGTRGPEAATAVRRQWLAMFADAAHMQALPGRKTAVADAA